MQSPETGGQKSPQELLEMNTINGNEAFLEALAAAITFEDVKDVIHDQTRVMRKIKKSEEQLELEDEDEDEEYDYVVGHVFVNAVGEKEARFFHQEELLELVNEIEKNPSLGEQDIVRDVEHTDVADALIRIAGNQK